MTDPVFDPEFWRRRLADAIDREMVRCAVYDCSAAQWDRVNRKHREVLAKRIGAAESVLDVGCGWGRLLSLMPKGWTGEYMGIDLSPDFIAVARSTHTKRAFYCTDVRSIGGMWMLLSNGEPYFDWAVMVSIREMVIRNAGQGQWDLMERNVRRCAKRLLYLEYDPNDGGSIE